MSLQAIAADPTGVGSRDNCHPVPHFDGLDTGADFYDLIPLLYQTLDSDNPGDIDEFAALASQVAGKDLRPFVDAYLVGNEEYPLSELDAFQSSYEEFFEGS